MSGRRPRARAGRAAGEVPVGGDVVRACLRARLGLLEHAAEAHLSVDPDGLRLSCLARLAWLHWLPLAQIP